MDNKVKKIMKWAISIIFLLSTIGFVWVYLFGNYVLEYEIVKTLPLAIIIGLTGIATAIIQKD